MSNLQAADVVTHLQPILPSAEGYRDTYEQNRHRVYALAFWMTDNELVAEELMSEVFSRAFISEVLPTAQEIDRVLVRELRKRFTLGPLTLKCAPCSEIKAARRNTLRAELERAIVQLPATEKLIFLMHDVEGYDHARIAATVGLSVNQSICGLHQARLRIRELLAT